MSVGTRKWSVGTGPGPYRGHKDTEGGWEAPHWVWGPQHWDGLWGLLRTWAQAAGVVVRAFWKEQTMKLSPSQEARSSYLKLGRAPTLFGKLLLSLCLYKPQTLLFTG